MARSPTLAIGITFRDRDGNRSKATCYCPYTTTVADVWSLAYAIAARMVALSNALLCKLDITWKYTIDDLADPAEDSSNERKILLLVTNDDDEINGIVIPSPSDNWESLGAYAGIRLDLASAGAIQFAALLLSADLRTDDDRAVGTILAAGGLAI